MRYSIVGMQFRNADWLHHEEPHNLAVELKREPDNPYDINAVQVWIDGQHVGYIPKKDNQALARNMDKDSGEVTGLFVRHNAWPCVEIDFTP